MTGFAKDGTTFTASRAIGVALNAHHVAILVGSGDGNADVAELEDHDVASQNVVLVRFARVCRAILSQRPVLKVPCASRARTLERLGFFDARECQGFAEAPADERRTPRPSNLGIQPSSGFVFVHAGTTVCSIDFGDADFLDGDLDDGF